ncbi:MAG TPA: ABC transporter permease [Jatrophihabitans sp.]|jgi:ABC-2 type transport system permease protein|uniref:ABC transporter permease n=1 Tax=Jatrophihabitans sp. TaxID=1932789 RepID=UPI002EFEEEF7
MNPSITLATAWRVLRQLRNDPRTIAMLVVVPSALMILLRYIYDGSPRTFDRIGLSLLGVFPFVAMFLVTSVAMLRERTSGTLERLFTTRLAKLDLLIGYALAFAAATVVQVGVVSLISFGWLGLSAPAGVGWVLVLAMASALLGMAMGLLVSAFARTEFQAVQFLPAVVLPQFLLCGLLTPRAQMVDLLRWLSNVLPMSYAVEGLGRVGQGTVDAVLIRDVLVVVACIVAALALGAATLRRRTS